MKNLKNKLFGFLFCAAFVASLPGCSQPAVVPAPSGAQVTAAVSAAATPMAAESTAQTTAPQTTQADTVAPKTSAPSPTQAPATPSPAPTASPAPAWPKDAPSTLPKFQYGKCVACERSVDDSGFTVVRLDFQGVKAGDLDKYAKALKSGGYIVSRESTKQDAALSGVLMKGGDVVAFVMVELHTGTGVCSCELTYRAE